MHKDYEKYYQEYCDEIKFEGEQGGIRCIIG